MADASILWFRRDLRLRDNPALAGALAGATHLVPLYIHAPTEEHPWSPGGASRWWLHHSLTALDRRLRELGSRLILAQGEDSLQVLKEVIAATGARRVYWNRLHEPPQLARDRHIEQALRSSGTECFGTNGTLLFEPDEILTAQKGPYRVFSAYWRRAIAQLAPTPAIPPPRQLPPVPPELAGLDLATLGLRPRIRWDTGLADAWTPGEEGAWYEAREFLDRRLANYAEGRDRPDHRGTSRLSPHLHFGEISPRQLLGALVERGIDLDREPAASFLRELGWREFAHHLLAFFPETPETPLDRRFVAFPWFDDDGARLHAWQQGRTGIPLVDAGLRELWTTGWMHNRVRMVAASFLTKNLRLPWQLGARWFWDTLVDADLANNTLGWQWVAGCGADAAPFFRVFNPIRQGERFDPNGDYVRRWCPELARLPNTYIHRPWMAPRDLLSQADLELGRDYPLPIVDLTTSRAAALAAWSAIKDAGAS